MKKLLLVLTGGTICSFRNDTGYNSADTGRAAPILVNLLRESDSRSKDREFDIIRPLDTLSENMTVDKWNILLDALRKVDYSKYSGILILHGTDTLHLTAPLLGVVMEGCPIPVGLVSSNRILEDENANGRENFIKSVEYIDELSKQEIPMDEAEVWIFTIYGNSDGVTYLHDAKALRRCGDFSEDFFSEGMCPVEDVNKNISEKADSLKSDTDGRIVQNCSNMPLFKMGALHESVLVIDPYVGINYDRYDIGNVKHVLHLTYHSGTADQERLSAFSKKCGEQGVDIYLAPLTEDYRYSSTAALVEAGVKPMPDMTMGEAYARLLVGDALKVPIFAKNRCS